MPTDTTCTNIWQNWTQAGTTTATIDIWNSWVTFDAVATTTATATYTTTDTYGYQLLPEETTEQRCHREETEQQARNIYAHQEAIQRAQQAKAAQRAENLLLENLTPSQQATFKRSKHIIVQGAADVRYRIRMGRTGNIDVIDRAGRISHRLCAHPHIWTPDADVMLAQRLMIDTDEAGFLAIANRHTAFNRNEQVLPALQ